LKTFQTHFSQAVNKGVPQSEMANLTELIARESGLNPRAKNPKSSAIGYGQFTKDTVAYWKKHSPNLDYNNPVDQIVLTYKYAVSRYGSVAKALQFWDKNHWY
jgi:SLT domain-containing protein